MTQRERDEFFVMLAQAMTGEGYPAIVEAGQRLIRAASAHLRACEGDCSIPAPDGDYGDGLDVPGYWGKRQAKALAMAEKACPHGWFIRHQNDPRGGTLWLQSKGDENASGCLRIYPPSTSFPASVYR